MYILQLKHACTGWGLLVMPLISVKKIGLINKSIKTSSNKMNLSNIKGKERTAVLPYQLINSLILVRFNKHNIRVLMLRNKWEIIDSFCYPSEIPSALLLTYRKDPFMY